MYCRAFIFLILAIAPRHLYAQINKLSIATGLAWGINGGKNNLLPADNQNMRYTLAAGNTFSLAYNYYPDSSHAIVGFSYTGTTNKHTITNAIYSDKQQTTITLNYFGQQAVLQTGYWFKIKKIHIETQIGAILPLKYTTTQSVFYKDSTHTSITTADIKHYMAVGFNASLKAEYTIQKNIRLFAAMNLNLLKAKIKSSKIANYTSTNGTTLENAFPTISDREIHYLKNAQDIRNNKASLPNSFNKNAPIETSTYSQSFSNIGFQIGFSFLF